MFDDNNNNNNKDNKVFPASTNFQNLWLEERKFNNETFFGSVIVRYFIFPPAESNLGTVKIGFTKIALLVLDGIITSALDRSTSV